MNNKSAKRIFANGYLKCEGLYSKSSLYGRTALLLCISCLSLFGAAQAADGPVFEYTYTKSAAEENLTKANLNQTIKMSGASLIEPAQIYTAPAPIYPLKAYRENIEGWVDVEYQVDKDGRPINVSVVNSDPELLFDDSAVNSVKKWEFFPEENIETREKFISKLTTVKIKFKLNITRD